MIKHILPIIILVLTIFSINAQELKGTIKDIETNEPLENATILLKKTKLGGVSDEKGNFSITGIPEGKYTVEARFVGYANQQLQVNIVNGETSELNFDLTPEIYIQEQVVVTANKLGIDRDNAPLNVTVINQWEIEQSTESNILPVISSKVSGLFVTERGVTGFGVSPGSAGKISIRGVGGGESSFPVLLLIDGQPQFMGIFGHPIPDSYVSSDIEKVEVLKGPASVLYGTNAMGGVINLITRKQKEQGFSLKGRLMYGSFNTQKYSASTGYKSNGFSITGSFNHDQTDGHRPNSNFNINNGYVKINNEINHHFTISADVNHSLFKAYDPGSVYYENPEEFDNKSHWVDIARTNTYFTLSNKFEKMKGGIKAYYTHGDHDIYDGWKSVDENIGLSFYQGLTLFDNNLISFGFEMKKYGGKGTAASLGELSGNWVNVNETGVYLIAQHRFFKKLSLNSGIRLENNSLFGNQWVPQFGAAFDASEQTKIKASVSKGFRSPTVRELYLFPAANAELMPETMWNYEATLIQHFDGKKGKVEITAYFAEGENLIIVVSNPTPPPPVKNQNSGSFSHKGIEVELNYRTIKNLNLSVTYSYLNMDSPKVSAPKHQLFIGGNYTTGKFDISAHLHRIGELYTNTNPVTIQDYILVNSKINFRLNKNISMFLSGENLLDVEYQVQHGYPMPGFTIFSGINLSI
ncbi:MAG: TonB-dependent receptor [Mariniphaga sp.]|nr:TonB-dependent receptor [Mariniphaga sp.]